MARSTLKDPLDKFRFTVLWEGATAADGNVRSGFQTCQMPKRNTTKVVYREGTDSDISYNSAGLTSMEDIVLARGLIAETDGDFYKWVKSVHNPAFKKGEPGQLTAPKALYDTYRRNVTIRMHSRTGKVVKAWRLFNAFPINFTPGADLDSSADDAKSVESLTLGYDDFMELTVSVTAAGVVTLSEPEA